ncbi:STM4015 family protein [Nocardia sp. NPDC003963]
MIGEHLDEFGGLPVHDFPVPWQVDEPGPLPEADSVAWRIAEPGWDDKHTWEEVFGRFLDEVDTTAVHAIVAGIWPEAYDTSADKIIACLVAARDRLPALRAVFLGDITVEESEISWIMQGHIEPLLTAYPDLEELGIRGGTELVFAPVHHEHLRTLTVQTGGLEAEVVRGIAASDLPALERLELWLGTENYGADVEIGDLAPILLGHRLPALEHLALRNSDIQDEICAAVASAPVVARLTGLDLSMGILGDDGAGALLGGQPLTHLRSLDLHHNYLGAEMSARLRDVLTPAGVRLDLDPGDAREYVSGDEVRRYVSVSE